MENKILNLFQSSFKLVAGIVIGAIIFGGSAFAYNNFNSDNTPEGGYLLCANVKTKAVTFPNKLSCPAGTIALDLGAVQGVEGPQGPQGPAGVASTASNNNYYKKVNERDLVVDGVITSSSNFKKVVMGSITPTDLPFGYYRLDAHLSGLWSETVFSLSSKPMITCYFQDKKDYDAGSKAHQWGSTKADYVNWTGLEFNVQGYVWFLNPSDSQVLLVCESSGSVKQFSGMIEAFPLKSSIPMNSASTSGIQ
jgi:hypothetical protein